LRPDGLHARAYAGLVEHAAAPGLADHEVFQHRVPRHQVKMLVHHTDTGRQRVRG